jgi:hypothetical protein
LKQKRINTAQNMRRICTNITSNPNCLILSKIVRVSAVDARRLNFPLGAIFAIADHLHPASAHAIPKPLVGRSLVP